MIWAHIRQGNFDRAHDYAEKLLALYPENMDSYSMMAETLLNMRNFEEAEAYYRKWEAISDESGRTVFFNRHRFALILWLNGKKKEANELFYEHMEVCGNSIRRGGLFGKTLAGYDLAGIHAFLGDKEEAYNWLRIYEKDGFIYGLHKYILIDPLFASLWEEEEFEAIAERQEVKLAEIRAEIDQLDGTGDIQTTNP